MVTISRVGTHRHIIHGAQSFSRNKTDGSVTVKWSNGSTSWHAKEDVVVVDERGARR